MEPPKTAPKAMSRVVAPISRDHTTAEWESYQELFTQLYVVENKTLPQVTIEMASRYGFHATQRQYKRKIAAWGLDKNIKDRDMTIMLQKQLKRKLEDGKDSVFAINGRPVPPAKIARYKKRKSVQTEAILDLEQMSMVHDSAGVVSRTDGAPATPPYMEYNTPAPGERLEGASDGVLGDGDRRRRSQEEPRNPDISLPGTNQHHRKSTGSPSRLINEARGILQQ